MHPIHDYRLTKGLSQYAVAKAIGMPQSQYSRIERGAGAIHVRHVPALTELFGLNYEQTVMMLLGKPIPKAKPVYVESESAPPPVVYLDERGHVTSIPPTPKPVTVVTKPIEPSVAELLAAWDDEPVPAPPAPTKKSAIPDPEPMDQPDPDDPDLYNYNLVRTHISWLGMQDNRKARGWSQQYVADLLGVSQATYSRIENGETRPTVPMINYLVSVYAL